MHNHEPKDYVCPFCALMRGETPNASTDVVYHNEFVTAFLSLHQFPKNLGNTLVVPNTHFENIFDLPTELATELHAAVKAVAIAMKQAFQCDGVSTRQHNEPAGNQDVWHYHIHVTPRYVNDHLYGTRLESIDAVERAALANQLRQALKLSSH